jgi:hypothetical protein
MEDELVITADVPDPAEGRQWLATALLEAPDENGSPGEWKALESAEGPQTEMSTRHAEHPDGWYRLQWYNDGQVSQYSPPVRNEIAPVVSAPRLSVRKRR